MDTKRTAKNVVWVLALVVIFLLSMYLLMGNPVGEAVKYSEVLDYFKNEQVTDFTVDFTDGKILMYLDETVRLDENKLPNGVAQNSEGKLELTYNIARIDYFREDIKDSLDAYNKKHPDAQMTFEYMPPRTNWLVSMLPYVLLIGAMFAFYWFMMRRLGSAMGDSTKQMSFGKARVKKLSDEKRKTTFADVAGADEEKEELREIVGFLKNQKRYQELGARIPKGFLLVGPPGTGKTLLARAVAGEAGANFYSISGSDFVEMFVGVGASRVRDLFEQARRNVPCIIFIDEIDAVGRQRGAGLGGGHDEREQTLNQLLVEMDGFGTSEGVVMIAATNRPDILDPALLRPGRFDRQIIVGYPDIKGREEILKVHAKGKPLAPDVSLRSVAKSTAGFTGADLENLLNESALLAARREKLSITQDEIEEATIKVVVGTEKKSHVITPEDKRLTAYHEAGHALTTYYSPTQDPVHQISVIPRGMAGGFTMQIPEGDTKYVTKTKMFEQIVVAMGGRVAEALILDDVSTGASGDIEHATSIARSMVTRYGMSSALGPVLYGGKNEEVFLGRDMGHSRNYSEEVAARIDQEVHDVISGAYEKAMEILKLHMDKLHKTAEYLIEHEKVDGKTFAQLMEI